MEADFQLAEQLAQIKQQNLYRQTRCIDGPPGVQMMVDGRAVLNFCSNDYLGLANHPTLIKALQNGAQRYGVGSGSAHLVCGHSHAHQALEAELAAFTGRERALLFSTGYMANLGAISALLTAGDTVLEDRLNHASLLDGGLHSGARFKRYRHNDMADLQSKLSTASGKTLIVSDGVFSMDGDLADVSALAALAKQHQVGLMIDDAHGFGVLGASGGGIVEHYGLNQQQVPVLMGTLGKAFGSFGAFIAGSHLLIETLIQKARTYLFTTAMPAAQAEVSRASLQLIQSEAWRRDKLHELIAHFRRGAEQRGLQLLPSATAIQPLIVGDSQRAVQISQTLLEQGFWLAAIRPPTVPADTARLRITLSANHEHAQLDRLLIALEQSLR